MVPQGYHQGLRRRNAVAGHQGSSVSQGIHLGIPLLRGGIRRPRASPGDAPATQEVPEQTRNPADHQGIRRQIPRGSPGEGSQLEQVVPCGIFSPCPADHQGQRLVMCGESGKKQAQPLGKCSESGKTPREKNSRAEVSEPEISSGKSPGG